METGQYPESGCYRCGWHSTRSGRLFVKRPTRTEMCCSHMQSIAQSACGHACGNRGLSQGVHCRRLPIKPPFGAPSPQKDVGARLKRPKHIAAKERVRPLAFSQRSTPANRPAGSLAFRHGIKPDAMNQRHRSSTQFHQINDGPAPGLCNG